MILVIIPVYNETKRIGAVVSSLLPRVDGVVVVDDGSHDDTARVANDAGAVVLSHAINRGQGAALQTGHEYARRVGAEWVVHFDGDGQFDPEDVTVAVQVLQRSGADMLLGTRYGKTSDTQHIPWFKRTIIHPLAKLFHRVLFRLPFSDAHNGFRVLTRKALDAIVITQDRMAHATEIPALAVKHGLRVIEHPVQVRYHEFGQKPSAAFGIVKDLFFGWFVK